jgi:hypothetical protein
MSSSVPATGPIRIDCRGASAPVALRRIEAVLKRMRRGARALVVRVDAQEVLELVLRWVAQGGAPYELVRDTVVTELRIYLLPLEFDGHPLLGWRPALHASDRDYAAAS